MTAFEGIYVIIRSCC